MKRTDIHPIGRIGWSLILTATGLIPMLALPRVRSFDVLAYGRLLRAGQMGGIGRYVLAFILGAGVLACLLALASGASRRRGSALWLAALALGLGPVLSSVYGSSPRLPLSHLALPLLATAAYLLPPLPAEWLVVQLKRICLVWIFGSALAAAVAPHWALELPYTQGYISAIPVRLHGLAVHAGQLALICVLYLTLDLWRPSRSLAGRFCRIVVVATLFLTQYKTAWAAMIVGYALWKLLLNNRSPSKLAIVTMAAVGVLVLVPSIRSADALPVLSMEQQQRASSLTGRTQIWHRTLEAWRANPLFGYGPHLWDPEMALRYASRLQWTPAQAHNQYLQSLAETGLIGLGGLAVYLLVLGGQAMKYRRRCGVAVLLVLVLVLRGITDTWYRAAVADGNLFFQLAVLSLLMSLAKSERLPGVRLRAGAQTASTGYAVETEVLVPALKARA